MTVEADSLVIESPIGDLLLNATAGALTSIDFLGEMSPEDLQRRSTRRALERRAQEPRAQGAASTSGGQHEVLRIAAEQLAQYFAGRRREFSVPLALAGTDFQRKVWEQLCTIPYGVTASYGEIALALGKTGHGARAVGTANGRNPIPILVPCHRVVGASGALTGYGGGMSRKVWLLQLEGAAL